MILSGMSWTFAEWIEAKQYIKLIGTYSDHIALPELNRMHLFDGIADLINKNYGGSITKYYETALAFRRKKA